MTFCVTLFTNSGERLKTIEQIVSENLRLARGGKTQRDIAKATGLPYRTYQNMEAGLQLPHRRNLEAVAKLYGVLPKSFFVDQEEKSDVTLIDYAEAFAACIRAGVRPNLLRALASFHPSTLDELLKLAHVRLERLSSEKAHRVRAKRNG